VVELEVWDVVGDVDEGVELEEDPVYSFNTLLNGVDVGVLDGDEEDGVGTGDEVGDVAELFCELGCELADEDGVELDGVDVGVLDGDEEDGVGTGDEVGDVAELFCELGCELADEDGVELDGVDVGVLDGDEEVELCELALWLLGIDVGEDGVEDEEVELCELVDVDEGVEVELLCELALSIVLIALLRNRV